MIEKYLVRYPYISNQPGDQPDGNPILYLGLWMAIKNKTQNGLTSGDFNLVRDTYEDAQQYPGCIDRGKHKADDFESHDDYIGLIVAAALTGNFWIIDEVYDYGKANGWKYDNTGKMPWYRTWFGRYAGVIQHVKLAHRIPLNLFDQIMWTIGVGWNDGESGIQKAWLMRELYLSQPNRYWLCKFGLVLLDRQIWKYNGLMGGVFEKYFGKDHLFTRLMWGKQ